MANSATVETLALALEERLGAAPSPPFQNRVSVHFEGGQHVAAVFDPNDGTVQLTAPVLGAHDGLPTSVLRGLLQSGAYGGMTAGGTLRVRGGYGLEIADILPASLGAQAIANIMINQANAAIALSQGVASDVANSLVS